MSWDEGASGLRTETTPVEKIFEAVAVVARRLSLSQPEDVGQTEQNWDERDAKRGEQTRLEADDEHEEQGDSCPDTTNEIPEEVSLQSPRPSLGIGSSIGVSQS